MCNSLIASIASHYRTIHIIYIFVQLCYTVQCILINVGRAFQVCRLWGARKERPLQNIALRINILKFTRAAPFDCRSNLSVLNKVSRWCSVCQKVMCSFSTTLSTIGFIILEWVVSSGSLTSRYFFQWSNSADYLRNVKNYYAFYNAFGPLQHTTLKNKSSVV